MQTHVPSMWPLLNRELQPWLHQTTLRRMTIEVKASPHLIILPLIATWHPRAVLQSQHGIHGQPYNRNMASTGSPTIATWHQRAALQSQHGIHGRSYNHNMASTTVLQSQHDIHGRSYNRNMASRGGHPWAVLQSQHGIHGRFYNRNMASTGSPTIPTCHPQAAVQFNSITKFFIAMLVPQAIQHSFSWLNWKVAAAALVSDWSTFILKQQQQQQSTFVCALKYAGHFLNKAH